MATEDQANHIRESLDSLPQSRTELIERVTAQERLIERLRREFDSERQEMLEALRARDVELRRVRNTLAWAIVTWIGKVKYGYLPPLLRKARHAEALADPNGPDPATVRRTPTFRLWWNNLLDRLFRRRLEIDLIPGRDLVPLSPQSHGENAWESICGDPQFKVTRVPPLGWVLITSRVEANTPAPELTALFLDEGKGFLKGTRYEVGPTNQTNKLYLKIGPEVERVRLDPIEGKGTFRISKFTIQPVTRIEAEVLYKPRPRTELLESEIDPQPPAGFIIPAKIDPYDAWLEVNQWSERRESVLKSRLGRLTAQPLLSVVMPVYDPPVDLLNRAIESITGQVYDHWELCIADDSSKNPEVIAALKGWAGRDNRIHLAFRQQNGGISRATNDAAQMARGEFLVFVDNDDEISSDALGEVVLYLNEHPDTDLLYSDSDKIDIDGRRYGPEFKPDWSPELLLSYMYMNHLLVVRAAVFNRLGGDRPGFEGAQDYDLALRVTEHARHVGHIQKVLYHWRAVVGSTALSGNFKPASFQAGMKAVTEALVRRGIRAEVYQPEWAVEAGCGIFAQRFPDDGPAVTVIIPSKNNADTLRRSLDSLRNTSYRNYTVLVIDNGSDNAAAVDYLKACGHKVVTITDKESGFSFAHLINSAVNLIDSEYVLFLNDDIQVVSPDWLSQMVGYMGIAGVGAVGARLVFPDGRIEHAGVVHGCFNGLAGHAFRLMPSGYGYLSYAMVTRNYSAVTAACMLTRRDVFLERGGFDERTFPVAYNDVDYCYRLAQTRYRSVYCPSAELIHLERHTRGFSDTAPERAAFKTRYRAFSDPYYNPNLSLADQQFRVSARTQAIPLDRPIRALMAGLNLNLEGAPFDQLEMTVGLKEMGIVEPIVYSPADGPLRQEYESRGIEVKVFPHPLSSVLLTPEGYALGIRGFADWINGLGVEVVYGNTLLTFYAIAAATELGLPSVWNPREGEAWQTYFKSFGPYVATKALECFNYPYKVVFTANASEHKFEALNAHNNFMTIHDGLDRERFQRMMLPWSRETARGKLGVTDDQVVVLMIGTVCERKAQMDLLQAVARLRGPAAQKIRAFVVGDRPGEYSSRLAEARSKLDREKAATIAIVPETPEVFEYYAAADIYVCCSRFESFPRVILEAMAAGLPVITTPVDGIVEQVRDGSNAMFFQPGDVEALAEKLTVLINDRELRRRMGSNSILELDSIIDYESMVRAYGQVFQEAWLSAKPRAMAR